MVRGDGLRAFVVARSCRSSFFFVFLDDSGTSSHAATDGTHRYATTPFATEAVAAASTTKPNQSGGSICLVETQTPLRGACRGSLWRLPSDALPARPPAEGDAAANNTHTVSNLGKRGGAENQLHKTSAAADVEHVWRVAKE